MGFHLKIPIIRANSVIFWSGTIGLFCGINLIITVKMQRIPLTSSGVINPFRAPNPDNEKTRAVITWINDRIQSKSLDFLTVIQLVSLVVILINHIELINIMVMIIKIVVNYILIYLNSKRIRFYKKIERVISRRV